MNTSAFERRGTAILEVVTRDLPCITVPSNGIFHATGSTPALALRVLNAVGGPATAPLKCRLSLDAVRVNND